MLHLISRLLRLFNVLVVAKQSPFSIFKNGFSIASTELLHNISEYCSEVNTVIDVGANKGQFALAASRAFPKANVYSFEPLPEIYLALKKNIKNTNQIQTFNLALGSKSGKIDFYKNEYSHASSALPISDFHRKNLLGVDKAEVIQVPIERLDNVGLTFELSSPVLLKLDVQGFEKEVLLGCEHLLAKVDYLLFEASFIPMYDGEPTFEEMHEFVKSLGYQIVSPVNMLQTKNLKILQLDMLYKRL